MGKRSSLGKFRFKEFECSHSRSAMRIGVDGVLVGMWGNVSGRVVVDAGCGCGVIAMIAAQRNTDAQIYGIDIDNDSIEEAAENFAGCKWHDRLHAVQIDFQRFCDEHKDEVDAIISNPPFFNSGLNLESYKDDDMSRRMQARHQGELSPVTLLTSGCEMLKKGGTLSMILPVSESARIEEVAKSVGMTLCRRCDVRGNRNAEVKRTLFEFVKDIEATPLVEELVIEEKPGEATTAYRALGKNFYLNF